MRLRLKVFSKMTFFSCFTCAGFDVLEQYRAIMRDSDSSLTVLEYVPLSVFFSFSFILKDVSERSTNAGYE